MNITTQQVAQQVFNAFAPPGTLLRRQTQQATDLHEAHEESSRLPN
jgi:hypothetical protein